MADYNIIEWEETKLSYEKKDFYIDWTLQLQDGETIQGEPLAQILTAGLVLSEPADTTNNLTRVWLEAGTANRNKVAFKATTSAGRVLGVVGVLRLADVGTGPQA